MYKLNPKIPRQQLTSGLSCHEKRNNINLLLTVVKPAETQLSELSNCTKQDKTISNAVGDMPLEQNKTFQNIKESTTLKR